MTQSEDWAAQVQIRRAFVLVLRLQDQRGHHQARSGEDRGRAEFRATTDCEGDSAVYRTLQLLQAIHSRIRRYRRQVNGVD